MILNAILITSLVLLTAKLLADASEYEFAQRIVKLLTWPIAVMVALSIIGIAIRVTKVV